jgi:GTPase SAR1 family protein
MAILRKKRPVPSETDEDAPFIWAVNLSANDQHLAVVTGSEKPSAHVTVYQLDDNRIGEQLGEWPVNGLRPMVQWSPSGNLLAFIDWSRNAAFVRPRATEDPTVLRDDAYAVAFSPDESQLAVTSRSERNSELTIHLLETGRATQSANFPDGFTPESFWGLSSLAFSPDGQWLACNNGGPTVLIWDTRSMQVVDEFVGHKSSIQDLAWIAPDILATASWDQTVRIWQVTRDRELRVLETGNDVYGIAFAPAHKMVVGWTDHEFFAWSTTSWNLIWQGHLAVQPFKMMGTFARRDISVSARSTLLVKRDGPTLGDITFSHSWDASAETHPVSVSTYANAKVLLLGDSGVGKSGLALVIAGEAFRPTESTHARHIWSMPTINLTDAPGVEREVLLWDLAGQPGYRLIHQLHLGEATVALILFDSRSEIAPLAGVGHWARALRHAHLTGGSPREPLPTFLVAARIDRGIVGVSNERLAEVVKEFGFRKYLPTSALDGRGIDELRSAMLEAIDWSKIPVVTSSVLFAAAKSFVLDQKTGGTLLIPLAALHAAFLGAPITGPAAQAAPSSRLGRDLLDPERGSSEQDQERLRRVFEGCVARLESAGLVKRLTFGDLVLLQPELLDVYAGAIVNASREEPDGLGSMLESRVLAVHFNLPLQERITDARQEKLLVIATLEELTRHEIVLREETEEGVQLVFPSAFRRDLPTAAEPSSYTVEFSFEGPVANVYATLVVRIARSNRFTRRGLWQSAAQFEPDAGGLCTVHLFQSDEGRAELRLGYSEDVAELVRFQFERFIMAHLERHATPGTIRRDRYYSCPDCGAPFSADQVEAARRRGRTSMLCPVDETRVSLEDPYETLGRAEDPATQEMDASADTARSLATASSTIHGKEETTDFDVFLCHNVTDKPAVRWIAERLREQGILPWLDEKELQPGRPWQEELERQISAIRAAAVFVGPSGFGPWQNQELMAFLREFAKRQCPVIPVLLPGAVAPALPLFLQAMTWVDLREQDPAGIKLLIWGITGLRPELPV